MAFNTKYAALAQREVDYFRKHPGKSDCNLPDTGFSFKGLQAAQQIISPPRAGHTQ